MIDSTAGSEIGALERSGDDQATGCVIRDTDIITHVVIRGARGFVRIDDAEIAFLCPVRRGVVNAILILVFGARQQMAAAIGKFGARSDDKFLIGGVVLGRLAVIDRGLEADIIAVEDEVHDARDGIRAVGR